MEHKDCHSIDISTKIYQWVSMQTKQRVVSLCEVIDFRKRSLSTFSLKGFFCEGKFIVVIFLLKDYCIHSTMKK